MPRLGRYGCMDRTLRKDIACQHSYSARYIEAWPIRAYWCKVAYVGAIHTVCVLCMYVSQPCVRQHSHINRYTGAKTPPEVSRVLGMSKTSR